MTEKIEEFQCSVCGSHFTFSWTDTLVDELVEALEGAVANVEKYEDWLVPALRSWLEKARAVLAKARGEEVS